MPQSSVIIYWQHVMWMLTVCLPYLLGSPCSLDRDSAGSDFTSVSLFLYAIVCRVTFSSVPGTLKLHKIYFASWAELHLHCKSTEEELMDSEV